MPDSRRSVTRALFRVHLLHHQIARARAHACMQAHTNIRIQTQRIRLSDHMLLNMEMDDGANFDEDIAWQQSEFLVRQVALEGISPQ